MKLIEAKKELIYRYLYLFNNIDYILLPYYEKYYFKLPRNIILMLEEMLLGEKKLEETEAFKYYENLKSDENFLKKIQKIKKNLEKNNKDLPEIIQTKPNLEEVLSIIYSRIRNQISRGLADPKNYIIDEYFRIYRYSNDGKVWTSGKNLKSSDFKNCNGGVFFAYVGPTEKVEIDTAMGKISYNKPKEFVPSDIETGTEYNDFIDAIYNQMYKNKLKNGYYFLFTEKEKQEIYIRTHNELPFDFTLVCNQSDIDYDRPNGSEACGSKFIAKIDEIFYYLNPSTLEDSFYHLCPNCGYIVEIDKEKLSKSLQKKIKDKYFFDNDFFKAQLLKSELKILECKSLRRKR